MSGEVARNVARWGWVLALLVAGAVASCTSGTTTCAPGTTACAGVGCTDTSTDALNCGGCGITCSAGALCQSGLCTCPPPSDKVCGGQCVQSTTDPFNCGTCGHACGAGSCGGGLCACDTTSPTILLCPSGNPATDTCIETATNFYNCGGCTTPTSSHACYTGATCSGSTCRCDAPKEYCGTGTSTVCTNVQNDPKNCGACGTVCPTGQACSGGACQAVCPTGLTYCSPSCVDTRTDSDNCGGCAIACGAGRSCVGGVCQAACTTLQCGSGPTCCDAPRGDACCSGSCPFQHKNFIGQADEQTYYDCNDPTPYSVTTATNAARAWTPEADGGTLISSRFGCPDPSGSLCVVWKRNAVVGANAACAVFCYEGPYAGAATHTPGVSCLCPTTQQIDWY